MNLLTKATIQLIISLLTAAVIFTYFYPWLYNQINHITERGEDIDETIDFVNSLIMFFVLYILASIIIGLLIGIIFLKKRKK